MSPFFLLRSNPVCRLLWQLQSEPWQPFQRIPDTITFFTLPALISRGGYLHRDWGLETEDSRVQHSILQTGVPVPWGLQRPLNTSSYPTSFLCTPDCREKAMRIRRNFHQLVFLSICINIYFFPYICISCSFSHCSFSFLRDGWNGVALQSLWWHCIWFPLWSACMWGMQGKPII